jgi:hypothetical protein
MKCLDCKFYVLGSPMAIAHREGICKRFPQHVNMMKTEWCGEFRKPPAKRVRKKPEK